MTKKQYSSTIFTQVTIGKNRSYRVSWSDDKARKLVWKAFEGVYDFSRHDPENNYLFTFVSRKSTVVMTKLKMHCLSGKFGVKLMEKVYGKRGADMHIPYGPELTEEEKEAYRKRKSEEAIAERQKELENTNSDSDSGYDFDDDIPF